MKTWLKNNCLFIIITAALLAWYGFFIIRPIDIGNGDLGRHIQNGKIIATAFPDFAQINKLLHTNFYSYTFPDFPFINHHWATGLIFYEIWNLSGFIGLQFFFIFMSFCAFILFFTIAVKKSNLWIASPLAFLLMNIIGERREIRPEMFTYLFLGLLFFILCQYRDNHLNHKWLYVLPIIFIIWSNAHIYFIFGLFVLSAFLLEAIYKKDARKIKTYLSVLLGCVLASAINPHGFKILLYPFNITNDFGLSVKETLSVSQASPRDFSAAKSFTLKLSLLLFAILSAITMWKEKKNAPVLEIALGAIFGILAWKMLRNVTMYAFFIMPITAFLIHKLSAKKNFINFYITSGTIIVIFTLLLNKDAIGSSWQNFGVDLAPKSTEAAEFINNNGLSGPIFNDFNTGGYVIFYLYPDIKPFLDNRPEAYPSDFLSQEYAPMRLGEDIWYEKSGSYGFNTILISLKNRSEQSLRFINQRLKDRAWSVAFQNDQHIVFTKNKEKK